MSIIQDLKELIMPRQCAVCGHKMTSSEQEVCMACSALMPRIDLRRTDDNIILRMLWSSVPVSHAAVMIGYKRQSAYHNILMRMKYHGGQHLAYHLGRWSALKMEGWGLREHVDVIVPVPLSRKKKRQRGYNQSMSLAQGLADVMQLPVSDCLHCKDSLGTQKRLTQEQREQNVKASYTAQVPEKYMGKRFLIVDDVITTGATLSACAKAILQQSPDVEICVFALAQSL